MNKISILIVVVSAIFASCTNDIDSALPINIPPADISGILLKKTITTKGNIIVTDNYFYNGFKILKIVSDDAINSETKFTYSGELITKIEIFSNTELKYKKEYIYQNDKIFQILEQTFNNGTLSIKDKTVYDHLIVNGDEKMANYITYRINLINNQETIIKDGEIYFDENEVSEQVNTDYPISSSIHFDSFAEYTYDFKYNPKLNILGFAKLFDFVDLASKRNIELKKLTYSELTNGVWSTVVSHFYKTYTYNSLNFPTVQKNYNQNQILESTTQFFYD